MCEEKGRFCLPYWGGIQKHKWQQGAFLEPKLPLLMCKKPQIKDFEGQMLTEGLLVSRRMEEVNYALIPDTPQYMGTKWDTLTRMEKLSLLLAQSDAGANCPERSWASVPGDT